MESKEVSDQNPKEGHQQADEANSSQQALHLDGKSPGSYANNVPSLVHKGAVGVGGVEAEGTGLQKKQGYLHQAVLGFESILQSQAKPRTQPEKPRAGAAGGGEVDQVGRKVHRRHQSIRVDRARRDETRISPAAEGPMLLPLVQQLLQSRL